MKERKVAELSCLSRVARTKAHIIEKQKEKIQQNFELTSTAFHTTSGLTNSIELTSSALDAG